MVKKSTWLPNRTAPNQNPHRIGSREGIPSTIRSPILSFILSILFLIFSIGITIFGVYWLVDRQDVGPALVMIIAGSIFVAAGIIALARARRAVFYKDPRGRY